jgi:hypothetical protein
MEAVRTSETSVDNHSTRQYNPEDSSEHHTRRRENLKSHMDWILKYSLNGLRFQKVNSTFALTQDTDGWWIARVVLYWEILIEIT